MTGLWLVRSQRMVGALVLGAVLCGSGVGLAQMQDDAKPAAGMSEMARPSSSPSQAAIISKDEQILQVLNRLTYGPRPGDLERVKAMGLNEWLKQQFNPQRIDDSALDKMLADYPAMTLPLNKLMQFYPDNQTIRQAMNGKVGVPRGDAEKAIYKAQEEKYKARKAKKDGADAAMDDPAPLPDAMRDPDAVLAMDPEARFKALCKLTAPQVTLLRKKMTDDQRMRLTAGFTPAQVEAMAAFDGPQGVVAAEEVQTKLLRDIFTERQMEEVMVDFWLNHFNVYIRKSQQAPYFITSFERDSIRPFAFGHFEDLLVHTAMSPAMLNYLDNASSIGPNSMFVRRAQFRNNVKTKEGLNENYARELMELHTLGVNGGYTQHDVTEVAKVFTGWTVGKRPGQDMVAQPEFDIIKHEPGDKYVLGVKIKSDNEHEGMKVLQMLANRPETARFISTKMAVRFVSDDPPQALVDRMTAKWIETHGDIRQVILAMISSPDFVRRNVYRAKVKTPQEFVVSAVRASGAQVLSTSSLVAVLGELGMPIYGHQTPDGYSMKAEAWNNTAALVARMNFALALATNRVDGVKVDWVPVIGGAHTAEEKDAVLEDKLLHMRVSERTRDTILAQIDTDPAQRERSLTQIVAKGGRDPLTNLRVPRTRAAVGDSEAALAAGLLFGSPEFQRH